VASARSSTTRRAVTAAVVVGLALVLGIGFVGCRRPPQMGAEEEVFQSVDALFTAVTARDEKLLGECEQRLQALKAAGKLPGDASDYLDGVITKAHAGCWESAAEKLYDFMRAQRREGARDHPTQKKDKGRRDPRKK
jgi:hypothetical protein